MFCFGWRSQLPFVEVLDRDGLAQSGIELLLIAIMAGISDVGELSDDAPVATPKKAAKAKAKPKAKATVAKATAATPPKDNSDLAFNRGYIWEAGDRTVTVEPEPAPKAKSKSKAKAKGGMKRPARSGSSAMEAEGEAVTKAQPLKRSAASAFEGKEKTPDVVKRPAAAEKKNHAWKYLYHEDFMWVCDFLS